MGLFMMNNSRVINMSGACRLPGTPEQKEFDKKEYLMWPFYPELPILPKDIENIIIDYLYQLEHVELMTKCKKKIIDINYLQFQPCTDVAIEVSEREFPDIVYMETMAHTFIETRQTVEYVFDPRDIFLTIHHHYSNEYGSTTTLSTKIHDGILIYEIEDLGIYYQ